MPVKTTAAWSVEIGDEERRLLLEILADKLSELKMLQARAERWDVRHGLAERERALESLIARFAGARLPV